MSPWGHPEATEQLWCALCGAIGSEFCQRRALTGTPPAPTPRVRVCPPCYDAGARLVGPEVEMGVYFAPGRARAAAATVATMATPTDPPMGLGRHRTGVRWRRVEEAGRI